ncbi:hypothetical protein B0T18DRAFT_240742 [Schizothecium vesticola]|uniref:Secreted protein n=1 Tax=Schizothecium vesticola TaxID=314040 RepID=A0AA40EIH7_9PEZI|nr:hypothetical protein B0T18DRAFT_240742 [Schizothecium vesticola]
MGRVTAFLIVSAHGVLCLPSHSQAIRYGNELLVFWTPEMTGSSCSTIVAKPLFTAPTEGFSAPRLEQPIPSSRLDLCSNVAVAIGIWLAENEGFLNTFLFVQAHLSKLFEAFGRR